MWAFDGRRRPDFAEEPGPGQESVWDYPRPPALVACHDNVLVQVDGLDIARSNHGWRVLETASPPTFYLPAADIDLERLQVAPGQSFCEWKGAASYWALRGKPDQTVGWSYPDPSPRFADLRDAIAFYPGRVACFVNGERVRPQPGGFYGGWVTDGIVGPWKGEPGTNHW